MVATRSWERLGFARLADYARERVGISGRQLQDLAHTSARLSVLPRVEVALASELLAWSQARLIARVATHEDEARWLDFALSVRVRDLEHAVRAVDRSSLEGAGLETDEDGLDADVRVGVVVRCTPRVRAKFHAACTLARRVAGESLPVWACMEAVAAEALSALPVAVARDSGDAHFASASDAASESGEKDCASAGEGGASWTDRASDGPHRMPSWCEESAGRDRASAAANVCAEAGQPVANVCAGQGPGWERVASLLDGLDHADAFDLDARLCRAVALEQQLDADLAPLLAALASPDLENLARDRLGISPRKARALRRIERAAVHCPELRAAFRSGRLSWVQVQALLPVLFCGPSFQSPYPQSARTPGWWIEHAAQVSVRRLCDDVDQELYGTAPERQTCAQTTRPEAIHPTIPHELGTEPETERFFFNAPPDVARLFRAVACSVRRHVERATGRLPSEGAAVEWMFDHAYQSWGANDPRVRAEHRVFERDGWRCTVPGCSSYRNLHDHHVVFRAAGGSDYLGNRTTLCAWHHLRGVHAARVRCHGTAPGGLVFELGLRTGRAPLLRYTPGEQRDAVR